MAEDQGINGDIWNDQGSVLLKKLNWLQIGDSNIDIPNEDGTVHGVDRMFKLLNPRTEDSYEGLLLEAKRYKTTSFTSSTLDGWVKTLDKKLSKIKNSKEFYEKYPEMSGNPLRTGVIMIWFHNFNEYFNFYATFLKYKVDIKLTRKSASPNKIYVLENYDILRLSSVSLVLDTFTSNNIDVRFYYPASTTLPASRSKILDLNYMYSKFILAEYSDKDNIENKLVFYFGNLDCSSFLRLKYSLISFGYIDKDRPLTIYTYKRDDEEFRKVRPNIVTLFQELNFNLKEMDNFIDLPTFMRS